MRGTTGVILEHQRILRLPRKMTVMTDPRHIWNAIYNARNNRWHPPTSPNTAPATQNDSPTFQRNFSKTAETSFPMRGRSELDPSWIRPWSENETVIRNPPRNRGFKTTTSILYWKIQHFALRLSFQISPNTAPATKSDTSTSPNTAPATQNDCHDTVMTDPRHIWNAIYNARNNRWHPPTSPNTAPATQNDSPTFQRNFSKTAETSFPMRGRSENDPRMIRATSEQHPSRKPSAATRLATEVTFQDHHEHFVLKNTTFRAPAIIPNFTEYCACHEKWHFNFTEYCACHEKWHLNVTK